MLTPRSEASANMEFNTETREMVEFHSRIFQAPGECELMEELH